MRDTTLDEGSRRREQVAAVGTHHDQDIVVLGIDVLKRLERRKLGVLIAEEHAVIG